MLKSGKEISICRVLGASTSTIMEVAFPHLLVASIERGAKASLALLRASKQVAVERREDRLSLSSAALVTEMRAAVPAAHVVVVVLLDRLLPALTAHKTTSAAHVDTAIRAQ
jgi:hypothetical protein